jgi:hypothetical protein
MKKNGALIERHFFMNYFYNITKPNIFVEWDEITSGLMLSRLYG